MMNADELQAMEVNAEIQKCYEQVEFWTNKLETLELKQQRMFLFARIRDDPARVWDALPEDERTKEVVLAILDRDPHFFGECPWDHDHGHDGQATLPDEFCEDRDVALVYARGECYEEILDVDDYWYDVPEFIRDDEEVAMAVCGKHWQCLNQVSPRLRDNKSVILAAINADGWDSHEAIHHASGRLRGDTDVLLAAVKNTEYSFSWLESLARFPDVEVERTVAMAVAKRLPNTADKDCWYLQEDTPLAHFSTFILDDEEIMLEYFKVTGYCLKWCSKRLRWKESVIKAAVKTCPRAVEFSLGKTRMKLMSDVEFMRSVIRDGGVAMLAFAPSEMQRDKSVVLEAVANGLKHRNVPSCFRSDPDIALKSLQADAARNYYPMLSKLDKSVRITRSFALTAVKGVRGIFCQLPEELQRDEQIALQALSATGTYLFTFTREYPGNTLQAVFEKNPSLLHSREAMKALTGIETFYPSDLSDIVSGRPPTENKMFVLAACQNDPNVFPPCSARFRADRDVVLAALSTYVRCGRPFPFYFTTKEFQLENIDVVIKAIEVANGDDRMGLLHSMPRGVWSHRSVVLAWLESGLTIFKRLSAARSPFCEDRELIKLAVKNDWSEIQYVPATLKADREFVLSMVQIDGRVLSHAADDLKRDYEILTAAIASASTTITACFSDDDSEFLFSYAIHVREKLALHDVFVREILRGMSTNIVAAVNQCHLTMLDQGVETTTVFKRSIAQFLGVPLREELHLLRAASSGLVKYGF